MLIAIGGIIIAVLFIAMFILQLIDSMSGTLLNKKFVKLGNLRGLNYDDIVDVVGKPNAISNMANGQYLVQWIANNYHIALLFDKNNVCLGISSETMV